MSTIVSQVSNKFQTNSSTHKSAAFFKKHGELIAALTSGLIILAAWIFKEQIPSNVWIILNLIAFVIGGFAKAKEGIIDTVTNKQLNVEILMILAAIGSAAIGYWTEGAVLIFIFALSGALETYTMNRSEREIASLMDLQPEQALRIQNGKEELVDVSELQVGDYIFIKAGERIPADGKIIRGNAAIDESAITGESIPATKHTDQHVFTGTVNLDGSLEVEVTKTAEDSLFQKIIDLVQSAQSEKSPSQLFIERFERIYVKAVLLTVAVMMVLPHYVFGWSWTETIYRAMILLVVASPCALVASIMPATLSAISNGARNGVLFKGGVHLETLAHVKAVALDKTGTLTNGKPVVTDSYFRSEEEREAILTTVTAIERESNHPLAQAIVEYGESEHTAKKISVKQMRSISGNGVTATIDNHTWKIGNAAFVGEKAAYHFHHGVAKALAAEAKSLVFVADETGIAAVFGLKDTIREDSLEAMKLFEQNGIHTIMLTGDNETTAHAIAQEANITDYIAECLPEDKVNTVKELRNKYKNVAMVGDGINDAPALASANVGVSMGTGTDVALETADVVLMKNSLAKLVRTISLAKRMNKIVKQNIIFSISVIAILILSNFFQVIDLPLGVIGHEGSTILVILNGLRLLR